MKNQSRAEIQQRQQRMLAARKMANVTSRAHTVKFAEQQQRDQQGAVARLRDDFEQNKENRLKAVQNRAQALLSVMGQAQKEAQALSRVAAIEHERQAKSAVQQRRVEAERFQTALTQTQLKARTEQQEAEEKRIYKQRAEELVQQQRAKLAKQSQRKAEVGSF